MKIRGLGSLPTIPPTSVSHSVMNYKRKYPKRRKANRILSLNKWCSGKNRKIYFLVLQKEKPQE